MCCLFLFHPCLGNFRTYLLRISWQYGNRRCLIARALIKNHLNLHQPKIAWGHVLCLLFEGKDLSLTTSSFFRVGMQSCFMLGNYKQNAPSILGVKMETELQALWVPVTSLEFAIAKGFHLF